MCGDLVVKMLGLLTRRLAVQQYEIQVPHNGVNSLLLTPAFANLEF